MTNSAELPTAELAVRITVRSQALAQAYRTTTDAFVQTDPNSKEAEQASQILGLLIATCSQMNKLAARLQEVELTRLAWTKAPEYQRSEIEPAFRSQLLELEILMNRLESKLGQLNALR